MTDGDDDNSVWFIFLIIVVLMPLLICIHRIRSWLKKRRRKQRLIAALQKAYIDSDDDLPSCV
jgi:hypothetical protein